MRTLLMASALLVPVLMGCESMNEKLSASRQDRCERADWAMVGERDGVEGVSQGDRYAHICGELYQEAPYKQGVQKGMARRPRPPV